MMAWYWKALLFYASGWLVIGGLLAIMANEGKDWHGRPLSQVGMRLAAFFVAGAMWPYVLWKWVRG
jgi:hypothetical protein